MYILVKAFINSIRKMTLTQKVKLYKINKPINYIIVIFFPVRVSINWECNTTFK